VRFSAGHLLFRARRYADGAAVRFRSNERSPAMRFLSPSGSATKAAAMRASRFRRATSSSSAAARENRSGWCGWIAREKATGTLSDVASYFSLALSPDERQVAVVLISGSPENRDVYVVDVARDQSMRLTTDPGFDFSPVWSPDGLRIAFEGQRSGRVFIREKQVLGTAPDEPLLAAADKPFVSASPTSWSSDGRFIAYTQGAARRETSGVLPLGGNRQPFPVAQTAAMETSGMFSPNGRWLAYTSNEGRRQEIYVQPFPPGRPAPPGFKEWRQPSGMARGRKGALLPQRAGRDADSGADIHGHTELGSRCRAGAVQPWGCSAQPESAVRAHARRQTISGEQAPAAGERRAADSHPQLAGDLAEITHLGLADPPGLPRHLLELHVPRKERHGHEVVRRRDYLGRHRAARGRRFAIRTTRVRWPRSH
jgi:hypothetical protein